MLAMPTSPFGSAPMKVLPEEDLTYLFPIPLVKSFFIICISNLLFMLLLKQLAVLLSYFFLLQE